MMYARDQRGFTLIELLVAMVISMIVMGSAVAILTVILNDNRYDNLRDGAQADAQTMVDRLSRELRSASAPSAGSGGLLAKATSYDISFATVNATPGSAPTGNPANQIWVRYCLDGNDILWRQSTTPSSTTSTVPDTSACPSTSSAWVTAASSACCVELNDVTNEIGGDTTRPLFTFGPSGWSSVSQINSVQLNLYVDKNPGHRPGPRELMSGIYLRNELASPTANLTALPTTNQQGADVQLNGSLSFDPNGQVLSYQWYEGVSCPTPPSSAPSSGAIPGATTQLYDAGEFPARSQPLFALAVTNTGGLTNCNSQQVTIP
ncbi:MAG TPA: prepilin-type N-terminal cleavage/methylation domain-containing protein [Solirubrobacteraceae bacterium]|jgi:prepilin-type N-terminal cleavage/methylation domain-containing protein|nr:prepilin-type N-terminal cleavage/methylation domain-containing protein [Solirubrobacteraceae bacterium]